MAGPTTDPRGSVAATAVPTRRGTEALLLAQQVIPRAEAEPAARVNLHTQERVNGVLRERVRRVAADVVD